MTLELGEPYPADCSRVWRATLDGSPCVLKQPYDEDAQDRERLRRWALVRAVLSAAWTAEDDGTIDARTLRVAAALL